jgi:TolB-like protein/Tfp pilus assembly protein PilF
MEEVTPEERIPDSRGWKAATYISLVVIVALVILNLVPTKTLRAGDIQSLLVLPFENFTGDDKLDYVAAGMHSSLIGDIGQLSGLRVISKTTASIYKDQGISLPDMALELNVDAVVEPTVMCYGDSVCIQIRIITPFPEEKQIWIGEYKEEKSKIMSLYNRVTKQIANEVKVQLTIQEEHLLAESRSINSEAYDYYLKGLYYWDLFTLESLQLAIEYFNKAIELDPDWAPPHAGIAYYWIAIRQYGIAPPSITIPRINENLEKAFKLDPNSANTQYVSALVSVWTGFNWEKGEKEFLKVLEINPNDAFCRIYYAHLLMTTRRDDEAIEQCNLALDLDPMNPMIQALAAMVLAYKGEYERAIEVAKSALSLAPGNGAAVTGLYIAYLYTEDYMKSFEAWMSFLLIEEETRLAVLNTFDEEGYIAAAIKFAEEYENTGHVMPLEIAQLYAIANKPSKALDWLEKGYEDHDANIPYIGMNWFSNGPFKIDDPRLIELLTKMNLPLPED